MEGEALDVLRLAQYRRHHLGRGDCPGGQPRDPHWPLNVPPDAIQWDSLEEEMSRCAEYDIVPDYSKALELMTAAKRTRS
jgi:hypothetical protein